MDIPILFENNDFLIINKPSGLVVHSDGKTEESTVVDWILATRPDIQGVGEPMVITGKEGKTLTLDRPGIVHRIDRDTSGCLVIAKHQVAFEYIKEQFKTRQVHKIYRALVYGNVKNDTGTIEAPIGTSRKDFRLKAVGSSARGTLREAVTHYRVLHRYEDVTKKDKQHQTLKYTLLELKPETGRTHQIRVHLKHVNYPIVADPLYAGKRKPELGLTRTALHAEKISFQGMNGEMITIEASLPPDMEEALTHLQEIS